MTTLVEFEDALHYAAANGGTAQKAVRSIISEDRTNGVQLFDTANGIAIIISSFKTQREVEYPRKHFPDEAKVTNNIINDVSRICREMIGYSIVNTKRSKGEFIYEPVIPVPKVRAAAAPAVAAAPALAPACAILHYNSVKHCSIPKSKEDLLEHANRLGLLCVLGTSAVELTKILCELYSHKEIAKAVVELHKGTA